MPLPAGSDRASRRRSARIDNDRPHPHACPASPRAFPACGRCTMSALELYPGQVTALIGENGAGKSTLVKILTGIYQPDAGEITHRRQAGRRCRPRTRPSSTASPPSTRKPCCSTNSSVAENIYLGHAPRTRFGTIDWRRCAPMPARCSTTMGAGHIDADARLQGPRHRQQAPGRRRRAPCRSTPQIVIMDEPTAALRHKEIEELFVLIELLKQRRQGGPVHLATSSTRSTASPTATPCSATARWWARG